jgi:hypothetical protein
MRLRRSRRRVSGTYRRLAVAVLGLAVWAGPLVAQGGVATGGGLELVLPVGARAVGMGQAVVADFLGSESVWWNPAALGRQGEREVAIHHNQSFAVNADALTFVWPVRPVGVVALSALIYDYGTEDNTDATGTLGTISPQARILAATFAADVGPRAFLGMNYKLYERVLNCTGGCVVAGLSESTTALDVGAQFRLSTDSSLFVGVALRNVGPRLQSNDAPQADPLPARLDFGATYAPRIDALGPDAALRFGVGVVNALPSTGPGFRLGADVVWQGTVHASAGYVMRGPAGSGPTLAVGATTGRLHLDIARLFSDNATGTGQPPTYFSLRYVF